MQNGTNTARTDEFLRQYWAACDEARPSAENATKTLWSPSAWAYLTLLRQGWEPPEVQGQDEIVAFVEHLFPEGSPLDEGTPAGQFSDAELIDVVLTSWWDVEALRGMGRDDIHSTKGDINDLALALLDVEDGQSVADLCCGVGSFMVKACGAARVGRFYGVDVSYDAVMLARMRASALGTVATIELGNMFEHDGVYDRIFLDAPWGIRARDLHLDDSAGAAFLEAKPSPASRADWLFVQRALSCLSDDGRLAVLLPNAALTGKADEDVRRSLAKSGDVSSVIALPKGIVTGTGVAANLILFERGSSDGSIAFVDATDLGKGRLPVTLAQEATGEVLARLANPDGKRSARVQESDLASEGWSLVPQRYLGRVDIKNAVPLASLVTDIGRGSSDPKVRQRVCDEPTNFRYLEIRDVTERGISDDLAHLTNIEAREERYCLKDGDLVLGKMYPFKVAVAHVAEGERLLCSGNFYIIRPDVEKVDPIYLKLFFESEVARAQIKRVSVGTHVTTFNVRDLRMLQVPMVPMGAQRKIVERYESLVSEISVYRRRIERVEAQLAALFPEDGEA